MANEYTSPTLSAKGFNCPHCSAFAKQDWYKVFDHIPSGVPVEQWAQVLNLSYCQHCNQAAIWVKQIMVWPYVAAAPLVHIDMPSDIAKDYEEARSVLNSSPRSSAALLRLCVQKLCVILGEPGNNINEDIGSLVAKGLSVEVQKALDIVRVVGNEQVHPGTLDVRDNPQIAATLFTLVNFIVDDRISKPKAIAELYAKLPATKLKGIANRDKPKP